ncbi:MAG: ABC transporter permease [Puniceicoccaceae bacterium]
MVDKEKNQSKRRFFQHRELLVGFTLRHIERQTKGSWLGLLWIFLNPLLMLGLFTVVFGLIMGGQFGIAENPGPFDYPLGIFIGLTVMGLVTESMGQSPVLILSYQNLVKKVVFPLHILPPALVGSIFFRTLMSCLMALAALLLAGVSLTWQALWFPLILLPMLLLSLGLSYILSALGVYFRDSQHLMSFLGQVLFYASAVFYPSSRIPEPIYAWLKYNPVLQAIELSRDVLLWNIPIELDKLVYLYLVGLVSVVIGYFGFSQLRNGFADVL